MLIALVMLADEVVAAVVDVCGCRKLKEAEEGRRAAAASKVEGAAAQRALSQIRHKAFFGMPETSETYESVSRSTLIRFVGRRASLQN